MNAQQASFIKMETKTIINLPPLKIKELPPQDQPINRLRRYGANSLSTAEILAAILQTPTALEQANRLLAHFGGLIQLARAPLSELQTMEGIGPAKAAQIKAALELGRRLLTASSEDSVQIRSPADAANVMMMEMMSLTKEHMVVMLLNSKSRIIKTVVAYVGSLNTSVIRVGELFEEAIREHAAAVIIFHNHPSGDPTPSPEDILVTELIVQAGKILDIDVLDHMIIGQQHYVSLKERGLGFK